MRSSRTAALSIVLTAWCFSAHSIAATARYHLSNTRLTWPNFLQSHQATLTDETSNLSDCGGVEESQVARWVESSAAPAVVHDSAWAEDGNSEKKEREGEGDAGLPAALTVPGTSVWLPMESVASLVWKRGSDERDDQPFFQSRGCFRFSHRLMTLESYGPWSCFQKCGHPANTQLPQKSVMLLQGQGCFCRSLEDFLRFSAPSDPSFCSIPCPAEDRLCGGDGNYHSVYDLPPMVFAGEDVSTEACFTGKFDSNGARLVISQQSCVSNSTSICVQTVSPGRVSSAAVQTYKEGMERCAGTPHSALPAPTPHQSSQFPGALYELFVRDDRRNGRRLQQRSFWLRLELKRTRRWLPSEQKKGSKHLTKRRMGRECTALTRNASHVFLQDLPCDALLPYLTSCRDQDTNKGSTVNAFTEEDVYMATAVGVTGLACLLIFLILAITLFILKRSGRLKIRQKPAFHSTGDWDPVEDSVAARQHREAYLADLQARLTQTRSFHLKPVTAPPAKDCAPSASSPATTSCATHGPLSAEYTDPKPLRNEYADISALGVDPAMDRPHGNEYEEVKDVKAKLQERTASSHDATDKGTGAPRTSRGADPLHEVRIYSEPLQATETDPAHTGDKDSSAAAVPVSAQPRNLTRPARDDYEEPNIITPATVGSSNVGHPGSDLHSQLGDRAEETDADGYSVPQVAHQPHDNVSSGTSGQDSTTEDVPRVSRKDEEISAEGSARDSGTDRKQRECLAVDDATGQENVKEAGSPVLHTAGPRGDMYAKPAKSGVLVVSLPKRTASTEL